MDKEELLRQLENQSQILEQEAQESLKKMKEIYSNESNYTQHVSPDLDDYYYPSNPNTEFTGVGIEKNSVVGKELNSLAQKRKEANKKMEEIKIVKSRIQQPNLKLDDNVMKLLVFDTVATAAVSIGMLMEHFQDPHMNGVNVIRHHHHHDLDYMDEDERRKHQRDARIM